MAFTEIAFKALKDILGEDNVTDDQVLCQSYSRVQWTADGCVQRGQIGTQMRPNCIAMPSTTEEVQAIVKLANRYDFIFIPRGSGMINSAFPTLLSYQRCRLHRKHRLHHKPENPMKMRPTGSISSRLLRFALEDGGNPLTHTTG